MGKGRKAKIQQNRNESFLKTSRLKARRGREIQIHLSTRHYFSTLNNLSSGFKLKKNFRTGFSVKANGL